MQLVINTYGAAIHRVGNLFEICADGNKSLVSPRKVQSILITTGVHLTSDAIEMAVEHNIDILFADKFGNPYGRLWHSKLGSTARIRRSQIELSMRPDGLQLGLQWVLRRFESQIEFLKNLRGRRTRASAEITNMIGILAKSADDLNALFGDISEVRNKILGIEGYAGRQYWQLLGGLLPERFQFYERSRNPARDEFNCLLNYAYGVLYGIVERACVIAGLDPYVGFIHTDNYNKTSLVFDIIEAYRIYAEETVFGLFSARQVTRKLFDPYNNGMTLNAEGKKVLLERYNRYLDEAIRYSGRNIKRRDIVQYDLHKFAKELMKIYGTERSSDE
ncbi:MAG TPA: CRISPR-associated endonuclease Cas1 [Candidatus Marinimicrobia bacterium]|nr:CRISPR-associated endonuclease Cas1 [Candidatus Neomarinimicrobiota bacterium]